MTDRAEELERKDKQFVWHPFAQMRDFLEEPLLIVESGDGCTLRDVRGKTYIDGVSSLWCNLHGHRRAEIDRAIREQLDRVAHSTLLGLANVPSIELAEKLVAISPPGLEKVFYSDDGATAVEVAIKMAFQFWRQNGRPERSKFVSLENAYHGDTLGAVSVGGIAAFHELYRPLLFDCLRVPSPYCYRCPIGMERDACEMQCAEEMERVVAENAHEIAAVVVEPMVQGAAGIIPMPNGYMKRLTRACEKAGALLIADEVAVGFGRTAKMFACEWEDARPDFLCCAKGLTGGYLPLAATLTTRRVFDGFCGEFEEHRTFFHGHTYTGNPLGCAAALASLAIFERDRVLEKLAPKIALLERGLAKLRELSHVGDVRSKGMMAGVELVRDKSTKEPFEAAFRAGHRVTLAARQRGLIIRPLGDVVVLMPPLAISKDELSRMLNIVREAICDATKD